MTAAFFNKLHPHNWIKDHVHLKTDTIEVVFGFFALWLVLMLFSYVVSLLIYWALAGLGIIKDGLYTLLFA